MWFDTGLARSVNRQQNSPAGIEQCWLRAATQPKRIRGRAMPAGCRRDRCARRCRVGRSSRPCSRSRSGRDVQPPFANDLLGHVAGVAGIGLRFGRKAADPFGQPVEFAGPSQLHRAGRGERRHDPLSAASRSAAGRPVRPPGSTRIPQNRRADRPARSCPAPPRPPREEAAPDDPRRLRPARHHQPVRRPTQSRHPHLLRPETHASSGLAASGVLRPAAVPGRGSDCSPPRLPKHRPGAIQKITRTAELLESHGKSCPQTVPYSKCPPLCLGEIRGCPGISVARSSFPTSRCDRIILRQRDLPPAV